MVGLTLSCAIPIKPFGENRGVQRFGRGPEARPPLPNSVSYGRGELLVTCGGWNSLVLLDPKGNILSTFGGLEGAGIERLREPVHAAFGLDKKVYVCDWRNHRLVILDSQLEYLDEFGFYGSVATVNALQHIQGSFLSFASRSTYLRSHFEPTNGSEKAPGRKSLSLLLEALLYRLHRRIGDLRSGTRQAARNHWMDKPNGVVVALDRIVVTQKNNRCISVFDQRYPYRKIDTIFGPKPGVNFGRLGNIHFSDGFFYVCDERAGTIWKLDENFAFTDALHGMPSGTADGVFLPFSCAMLDGRHLAVCGGKNIQIIDTSANEVVALASSDGELHGLAFDADKSLLYVADRLNGEILVLDVHLQS